MSSQNTNSELFAEFIGTFLLILIGNGAVAVSVWTGAYDLSMVALMWGLAVTFGFYACAAISGAHINPAVTIAMAVFSEFEWKKVMPYIGAQIAGAFVASMCIHVAFRGVIAHFEKINDIVRGQPGSQLSAMVYTTFAPNPAIVGTDAEAFSQVSHVTWFASEVIITAVLLFVIFYLIDNFNREAPQSNLVGFFIGLLVAALVAYEAPISMAALNPARDLGPRIWAYLTGWGSIAFPGPRAGFWIPSVSTIIGGVLGGAVYNFAYKKVFQNLEVEELVEV